MNTYKVLIPSAGLGTRLGSLSKNLNKALVAINNKPAISYVIEKFPPDVEIVIALGYKGNLVRNYVDMAHSDRKIQYVEISPFEGPGSGLGFTILQCKKFLQCPFVFCPNDTIVIEDIPPPSKNWAAYAEIENNEHYRALKINELNQVTKVCEKDDKYSQDQKPYTGILGIKDYEKFWKYMHTGRTYGSIRLGESYALRKFIENGIAVEGKSLTWFDTGNPERLKKTREAMASENTPEILEKSNESIWFVGDRVIKYNADKNFISERVERSKMLEGLVPPILACNDNMYTYRFVDGTIISQSNTDVIFKNLLSYLDELWIPKELTELETRGFKQICEKFYKEKTHKRVKLYFDKFSQSDKHEIINGQSIESLENLLQKIDWNWLSDGHPVRIHGDLHFENIVLAETGQFYLIDWRQNFGTLKEYGDLYYDLAKLLHGLIVSHELINKEHFTIDQKNDIIKFDLYRRYSLVQNERDFLCYLKDNKLDIRKVRMLTALIFLNIAALHHEPYNKLLFYLGKYELHNLLKE